MDRARQLHRAAQRPLFWKSLGNTLYLTIVGVPLAVVVALGIALLLNGTGVRGLGVFRTIFYLPVVIPGVAACAPVPLPAQPVERPASTRPSGSSASTGPAGSSIPAWAKNGIILLTDLGRRRRRDHLSGRAPGRVARPLRGRRGRRRRGLGQAAPRHDPDDQPGDPVQPDHRRDRGLPAVHRRPSSSATASRGRPTTRRSAASRTPCCCTASISTTTAFRYFQMGYASALAWVLLVIDPDRDPAAAARVAQPRLLRERAMKRDRDAARRSRRRSQRRRWSADAGPQRARWCCSSSSRPLYLRRSSG